MAIACTFLFQAALDITFMEVRRSAVTASENFKDDVYKRSGYLMKESLNSGYVI